MRRLSRPTRCSAARSFSKKMNLCGRVLQNGDSGFDSACRGFAARFHGHGEEPRAVVYPRNAVEVSRAVQSARAAGVAVGIRSGGHNYEGFSSRVEHGVLIDLSAMDGVRTNPFCGLVTAGPGVRMRKLTESVASKRLTLPLATGPDVGLGGLCLGGGFGLCSRRHGLTCDNVVSMEVVLADGSIATASDEEHPDLFWALLGGGGGNFGIVTSFEMRAHSVDRLGMFAICYPWDALETVAEAWQEWMSAADWGLTSYMTLGADRSVWVRGQLTPGVDPCPPLDELIGPMLKVAKPIFSQAKDLSPKRAGRVALGEGKRESRMFKSTSAFAYDALPREAIRLLRDALESIPPLREPPQQPSMVQLLSGGGQMAVPATHATAAYHRRARLLVQYNGYWSAREDEAPTCEWVVGLRRALPPWASGAYVNYADADLGPEWLEAYFGSNVARLQAVKAAFDPENFFRFPQSVPLPSRVPSFTRPFPT